MTGLPTPQPCLYSRRELDHTSSREDNQGNAQICRSY